ncbi:MAG: HAMP domain-containing histidine kinase [Peptostreptococcaceae bacterium]|nr:HAMP domain-containing histidine kinase [Peptostreptococcaceae bacterium]
MKFNFDRKSITFKLWAYFISFAAFLMIVLWFLQIFFLNNYYQAMKVSETTKLASIIASQYGQDDFIETIRSVSFTNDLYIHIETSDGTIVFSPVDAEVRKPYGYIKEMEMVKQELINNNSLNSSLIIPESTTGTNTLAYATFLHRENGSDIILYIFAPLFPVESTVGILRDQLFYVTVISLLLAFIISFYLSNRISQPIRSITNSARELSKGNYKIKFQGGHYSEIIDLADTLTYTSLELEKTYLLQKDLIANVSHELRTPLTMVKSYAEMIRDLSGDNPEKRKEHIKIIIDEADRLDLLVDDMLTLSKMQSGVFSIEKSNFDLVAAVKGLLDSYSLLVENEGYQIVFEAPVSVEVYADRAKILQVFSNLINNGVKYCGEDKTVIITIIEKSDCIRCQVLDHGMGISKKELASIWDRYYKASTNHVRTTTGSGLGLSIVKEIINQHSGKYGVESRLGKGSMFWFELKK